MKHVKTCLIWTGILTKFNIQLKTNPTSIRGSDDNVLSNFYSENLWSYSKVFKKGKTFQTSKAIFDTLTGTKDCNANTHNLGRILFSLKVMSLRLHYKNISKMIHWWILWKFWKSKIIKYYYKCRQNSKLSIFDFNLRNDLGR